MLKDDFQNFQNEVKHLVPFVKGLYISLRKKGWTEKDVLELISTAAKVCCADEMTGGLKIKEETTDTNTYGCDGRNEKCKGRITWNDVNWFTSSVGFCDCCYEQMKKNLSEDKLSELYNEVEGGSSEAAEIVCKATE